MPDLHHGDHGPVVQRGGLPRWCTRYGGLLSIPVVGVGVLIALGACAALAAVLHHLRLLLGFQNVPTEIYGFSLVCVLLSLWLLIGPVFAYINIGQAKKIEIIRGFYSPDLIARYFDQFWRGRDGFAALVRRWRAQRPNLSPDLTAELETKFAGLFRDDFGLSVYLIPSVLLTAVGFIVLFFGYAGGIALAEALVNPGGLPPITPLGVQLDLVSVAAIFGAFTWIVSDSITRNHQWTFHPSDLSWYALRLIIAVPLGQAISVIWRVAPVSGAAGSTPAALLGTGTGAFLAFVISMFSLDGITKILSNVAAKAGALPSATPEERNDVIVKLPGVDEEKASALRTEGVTTIAQLIAVDPIRTSIRTGLPFEYVLCLIDAALLWRYVGVQLDALREFGFTGASQVLNFAEARRPAEIIIRAREASEAAADLEAAAVAVTTAEAAAHAALAALGPPTPTVAEAQIELQQVESQLAAVPPPANQAQLQQRQALLRAATARSDDLAQATTARDAARDTLNARMATLLAATANRHALIGAIAAKTSMAAEGIDNVIDQLSQDAYADFVRRLLAP
jgi:hypothetical protein